jgi:hypothetical protein
MKRNPLSLSGRWASSRRVERRRFQVFRYWSGGLWLEPRVVLALVFRRSGVILAGGRAIRDCHPVGVGYCLLCGD